jgi:hypothetical protein
MSVEDNQDETVGFVTTSSDMPEVQTEPQEEQQQEEQANSEADATVGDEEQDPKGEAEEPKAEKQDDSGKDTAADHDKGKKSNRVQKRIDQVVREREQERREKEALQRRIDELENGKQSSKEPVEDDFATYDEYLDALDAYDNEQSKAEPKQDKQEQSSELTDSQKTAMAVIQESVASADKPEDFEAVALNPEVPVTGEMLEALAECEDPAKVMYHLGQNIDLAADIASGSPAQQMRAIAKLDLTVTSKPPKPTKTTNAPDPISPVGGSDAQEKAPAEMSFAEYEAHMNKKERSRQSW